MTDEQQIPEEEEFELPEGWVTPDKHYLPKQEELPDLGELVYSKIDVPVQKVPPKVLFEEKPFDAFGTAFYWLNSWGALTKEKFTELLGMAADDFSRAVSREYPELFKTYPVNFEPEKPYGMDYFDWTGASYPIDIRLIVMITSCITEHGIEHPDNPGQPLCIPGFKYYMMTLIALDEEEGC